MAEFLRNEALFNRGGPATDDAAPIEQIERRRANGKLLVAGFSRGYRARQGEAARRHGDAAKLLRDNLPEVEATRD